ncbi:hypothetical protein BN59_03738 [Legionella massiliensis]|uniref:Uncharacterized protein n=1 Tax=Legionella massiliensis TaxID=1034943 RepID=A0A078KYH7_9GAMM|nr:hypothetical protein BN59_03738 [Legionella massiliensis]CEE15158.1 hypothetical protein BN1094_03738 [Legionella massiliensis]
MRALLDAAMKLISERSYRGRLRKRKKSYAKPVAGVVAV